MMRASIPLVISGIMNLTERIVLLVCTSCHVTHFERCDDNVETSLVDGAFKSSRRSRVGASRLVRISKVYPLLFYGGTIPPSIFVDLLQENYFISKTQTRHDARGETLGPMIMKSASNFSLSTILHASLLSN